MLYLDTSVVVPLLTEEPSSEAVATWFDGLDEVPVSSDWLLTEFASAVSMKVRTGQLTEIHSLAVNKKFDLLISAGIRLVPVSRAAFGNAAAISRLHNTGIRSGDALHLTTAQEFGATMIATLDKTMAKNARRLKIGVVDFSRQ